MFKSTSENILVMYSQTINKFEHLSSLFTRKKGFTNIQDSLSLPRKKAIKILNSFTPQGASPEVSLRIGSVNNMIGAGYYLMKDISTAKLHTLLYFRDKNDLRTFTPPIDLKSIQKIADSEITIQTFKPYNRSEILDLKSKFGNEAASTIIYSLLSGDNMIIVDHHHENRLKFMATLLSIMPSIAITYNRITSGCYELDGNENIIGVDKLPSKYRSHKTLHLPLDTIFIDLENEIVEGNGMKNSSFTKEVIDYNLTEIHQKISAFYRNILDRGINGIDNTTQSLVDRIEAKLGIKKRNDNNWIMDF